MGDIVFGSFTDSRDGRAYRTIKVDGHEWLADNLAYKCKGAIAYNNDEANVEKYGWLYKWENVKQSIPEGWHLPTFEEWFSLKCAMTGEPLEKYMGSLLVRGEGIEWGAKSFLEELDTKKIKFFDAPGGAWKDDKFEELGEEAYFWTTDDSGNALVLDQFGNDEIDGAYSIRLIRDYEKPIIDHSKDDKLILELKQKTAKYVETHGGTFTDPRDGHVYKTIKIGNQEWFAENFALNCDGASVYDNDEKNAEKYGRLYDVETAVSNAPEGWHLPSEEEMKELRNFIAMEKGFVFSKDKDEESEDSLEENAEENAVENLEKEHLEKETSTENTDVDEEDNGSEEDDFVEDADFNFDELEEDADPFDDADSELIDKIASSLKASSFDWIYKDILWAKSSAMGTDEYGFGALPGGYDNGEFQEMGRSANFWSSSEDCTMDTVSLKFDGGSFSLGKDDSRVKFSVRYVKDSE